MSKQVEDSTDQGNLYQCDECALHYTDENLAGRCKDWCRKHNSCNIEIASQSVEARQNK